MNSENKSKDKEPWETTTQYGRVDLTLHPVLRECYRVACLIERCGASDDLTRASSAAFDLCEKVQDVILALCCTGIEDQDLLKGDRKIMGALLEELKGQYFVGSETRRRIDAAIERCAS